MSIPVIALFGASLVLLFGKIKPSKVIKEVDWVLLLFFAGLFIDGLTNSGGLHAASCVLIAFIRPYLLKMLINTYDLELMKRPSVNSMGLNRFLIYCLILVFIQNLSFYFLDTFTLNNFFSGLKIIALNTIITSILIIAFEYLFKSESRQF